MKKFTNIISVVGIIVFGILMIGATTPYTFNTITSTGTASFATVSVDGGSITLNAGGRIETTSMNVSDTMIVLNADGSASFADGAVIIIPLDEEDTATLTASQGANGYAFKSDGPSTITGELTVGGNISMPSGSVNALSATIANQLYLSRASANVGGTIQVNTTTTGNIGAGEDNLISYTVSANTLANDGEYLEFDCWGSFAATATLKQLRLYVDTAQFDTTSLLLNGKPWRAHGKIVRTDNTHCSVACEFTVGGTLLSSVNGTVVTVSVANPNPLDANSFVFKVTGQDNGITPADNAVVQNAMILKWYPAQ